jgi:hypothetical protein
MCIILDRHFRCSDTVFHVCRYYVRCSNPTFTIEDAVTANERAQRPCWAPGELQREEEWYDEQCPNCTGEIHIPKTRPVRFSNFGPPTDVEAVFLKYGAGLDDKTSVSVYARNLAFLLLSYLYSPETGLGEEYPMPDSAQEAKEVWNMRQVCVLNELICHVHPEHGSPWRLVKTGEWVEETQTVEATGWAFQTPAHGCECLSTQNPWLSNWALHIRRSIASDVYSQMVDPERSNNPELIEEELEHAYTIQKQFMANYRKLAKTCSCQLPVLEVLRTTKQWRDERHKALENDGAELLGRSEWDILQLEDAEEPKRLNARASLAEWVAFLLGVDSGLTLERARVILACFMAKVVAYDEHWRNFNETSSDSDPFKRLAHLANKYPDDVPKWVRGKLSPFQRAGFVESLYNDCTRWERQDRERAAVVCRNIVRADETVLEALRQSGDGACAICLEPFEEHDTALSRLPVQNWRCHRTGHKHWSGHACLVKSARTLQGASLVAPEPRCPMCRTDFEDPKPEEAAMVEDGQLALFVFEDSE